MKYENWGQLITRIRKEKQLSQTRVAELMTEHGMPTKPSAVSKWEGGVNSPNVAQFFMLCDILDIKDINLEFGIATQDNPLYKLNKEGQKKAYEYMDLLIRSRLYVKEESEYGIKQRSIKVFDLPVSAGPGEFLDSDHYTTVEVGKEVSASADFGVRISGDSMQPQYQDQQIVWIHKQPALEEGEIGIFYLNGNAYIKKFHMDENGISLISLNKSYAPIPVTNNAAFIIYGLVVS